MTKMTKKRTVGEAKQSRGPGRQSSSDLQICSRWKSSWPGLQGKTADWPMIYVTHLDPKLGHVWESQIVHLVH
jgi:hypothetical protein